MKRILGALLIALGVASMLAAPAAATNNPHKVWVCKYVGAPGDYEQLKAGKQPIQVDVSAADDYVGADFADGQTHSVVIDLVTAENTDNHNDYIGEATCPTPPATTTTTTEPGGESTTTTQPSPTSTTVVVVETSTTSVEPPTSTTQPETSSTTTSTDPVTTTSTVPETTSSVPETTTVPPSTTSSVPEPTTSEPSTSTSAPPSSSTVPSASTTTSTSPPSVPILPHTGSDSGPWLLVGFICLCFGLALILSTRSYRKTHPWEA